MPLERVTSTDLHLDLTPHGSRRSALAEAIRTSIRSGRLEPGTRLPSYRALANDLALARNTVADTYGELVSEGWLSARQGSGTTVAHRPTPVQAGSATVRHEDRPRFDLRPGRPDATAFPRSAWLASTKRAINRAPSDAFGPGDPRGRIELRRALAEYLARTRGVHTDPRRIVICSGFSQAISLLVDSVVASPVAVESYGLPFHRATLERHEPTTPLPIDENGCVTDELATISASTLLLTPSHQFPMGAALQSERRIEAIRWARARNGLVIEDDYDGEFRYDRAPIGAMQGLDPDHVLYVGSVSKSLSPSLRLGWMVVPESRLTTLLDTKGERESTVSTVEQLTLADFVASGSYDRHVRTMRACYRRRRDMLVDTLSDRVPHLDITGIAAGLQAVLTLPAGTEHSVVASASEAGLAIEGLSTYRHPRAADSPRDGLVVGYAAPTEHAYATTIDALATVLSRHS